MKEPREGLGEMKNRAFDIYSRAAQGRKHHLFLGDADVDDNR